MQEIWNHIDGSRFRLFGHVKRMNEHRIRERLLEMKKNGRRLGGSKPA